MSSPCEFWHDIACAKTHSIRTLSMKQDQERDFKIELRNMGSSTLGHIVNVRADVYIAESSFETKQSLDLLSNTKGTVRMTHFSLLKKNSLECDDVATLEITLRGQHRCKRVQLHITYAQHPTSKCTRCLTLCCEINSDFSSAVLRDVRVLSIPPLKCVPHIPWSRFDSETDSSSCAVLLDVENREEKTASVCLNDQSDMLSLKPNRVESIFTIIPRCESKDKIKSWFEKHIRIRLNGELCEVDVSNLSLRHFIQSSIRIDMSVVSNKASSFKVGDTIKLVSLVKLLHSNVIVISSEIFLWHSSFSTRSMNEMIRDGDICISGNTKRHYYRRDDDGVSEKEEEQQHALAFTPLVSGQYYASTCVCISSLDYSGEHRVIWWSGVLSLDVSD